MDRKTEKSCSHRQQAQTLSTDLECWATEVEHNQDDRKIRRLTDLLSRTSTGAFHRGNLIRPVDIPFMLVCESLQTNISLPPQIEVMSKVGDLKRHKAIGSFGLVLSFFKDGADMLTSELTKLLESICTRKENPTH